MLLVVGGVVVVSIVFLQLNYFPMLAIVVVVPVTVTLFTYVLFSHILFLIVHRRVKKRGDKKIAFFHNSYMEKNIFDSDFSHIAISI